MRLRMIAVACGILLLVRVALTYAGTAPYINHTRNLSKFCTSVAALAADVNQSSKTSSC